MISIIVPAYNLESWLAETIKSVQLQTHTEWELVLVDDGSTDGSHALMVRYAETDRRIRVIQQENAGVVAARYAGFRACTGHIVMFLDGDDRLVPTAMEVISREMASSPVDMLRFGFVYCTAHGERTGAVLPPLVGDRTRESMLEDGSRHLKEYASNSIWDKAYDRDFCGKVFEMVHGARIRHSEDILFSLFAICMAPRTRFIPDVLHLYFQRPGSAINSLNRGFVQDAQTYLSQLGRLHEVVPHGFSRQIERLITEEANYATSFLLRNAAFHAPDHATIAAAVRSLSASAWYRELVRFTSLHPKHLLRDIILFSPVATTALLRLRHFRHRGR